MRIALGSLAAMVLLGARMQSTEAQVQEPQHCARAETMLVSRRNDSSYSRAASELLSCPSTGPKVLSREWANPPADSVAMRTLSNASSGLRDRRLLAAVKGVAASASQSRAARLEAIRTLVSYFDPIIFIEIGVRPGIPSPNDVYVSFGGWSEPRGRDGSDPLPASTKSPRGTWSASRRH